MLKVEAPDLKPLIRTLEGAARNVPSAFARVTAVLRRGMKTETTNAATAVYNVGKQRVGKEWRVAITSPTSFTITGGHRPISLVSYGARATKRGVSVTVLRSRGRTLLRSSFIATGRAGNRLVFERTGKSRLPIETKYGPSAADMLKNAKVIGPIGSRFTARATKELLRMIEVELAKRG